MVVAILRARRRLAAHLKALRKARGLSQDEAAEVSGLHGKHLLRIESGRVNVTLATLVALSIGYRVPMAELFPKPRARKKK